MDGATGDDTSQGDQETVLHLGPRSQRGYSQLTEYFLYQGSQKEALTSSVEATYWVLACDLTPCSLLRQVPVLL